MNVFLFQFFMINISNGLFYPQIVTLSLDPERLGTLQKGSSEATLKKVKLPSKLFGKAWM